MIKTQTQLYNTYLKKLAGKVGYLNIPDQAIKAGSASENSLKSLKLAANDNLQALFEKPAERISTLKEFDNYIKKEFKLSKDLVTTNLDHKLTKQAAELSTLAPAKLKELRKKHLDKLELLFTDLEQGWMNFMQHYQQLSADPSLNEYSNTYIPKSIAKLDLHDLSKFFKANLDTYRNTLLKIEPNIADNDIHYLSLNHTKLDDALYNIFIHQGLPLKPEVFHFFDKLLGTDQRVTISRPTENNFSLQEPIAHDHRLIITRGDAGSIKLEFDDNEKTVELLAAHLNNKLVLALNKEQSTSEIKHFSFQKKAINHKKQTETVVDRFNYSPEQVEKSGLVSAEDEKLILKDKLAVNLANINDILLKLISNYYLKPKFIYAPGELRSPLIMRVADLRQDPLASDEVQDENLNSNNLNLKVEIMNQDFKLENQSETHKLKFPQVKTKNFKTSFEGVDKQTKAAFEYLITEM
jgi:hypothetical protein